MAELSPVSDTQSLLQSMLQRLKLQAHSSTHTQTQAPFPFIEGGVRAGENSSHSPVYKFGGSLETKQQETKSDNPWTFQSLGLKSGTLPPHQLPARDIEAHTSEVSTWEFTNSHTGVSEGNHDDFDKKPRRVKKLKFLRRRTRENNSSVSSFPTTENNLFPPGLLPLPPASCTQGYKVSEVQGEIWSGTVGDKRGDAISVHESTTQTHTPRHMKKADPGHKRWTQKVKERWHRNAERRDTRQKQEHNEAWHSTTFSQTNENITTTALSGEGGLHHDSIISGPDEAPPSPTEYMSESMFSFGSLNLMEEIFSGQEWAKFFPAFTSSQSESNCSTRDQATKSSSSINQVCQEKQNIRQWDYKDTTESNLSMAPSQTNSGRLQQDMDTDEFFYNQTKASGFNMPLFRKGHLELSDPSGSNQRAESLDPSLSHSQRPELTKHQLLDHNLNNQLQTNVHQSLSADHSLNHPQTSDLTYSQSESVCEEVLPLVDISYLQCQAKDSSSLRTPGSLSRKRGHCVLNRDLSEEGSSQIGEADEWREDAIIPLYSPYPDNWREHSTMPLYSLDPAPSLSPTSSVSSLLYSISQDSESSSNTETVVKKRRVENTRRVRFAKEVVILPALILSEDDDDDDDHEGDEESRDEPLPRPSITSWIDGLRSKAKKKVKLKPMASPQATPRTSK